MARGARVRAALNRGFHSPRRRLGRGSGAEGIRTPDPHNAIVVLYQLSYDPGGTEILGQASGKSSRISSRLHVRVALAFEGRTHGQKPASRFSLAPAPAFFTICNMKYLSWPLLVAAFALILVSCQPPQKGLDAEDERNPHFRRASTLAIEGNFYGAIREYEAALRANPEAARAHLEIGLLYSDKQLDPVSAIHHFQRYLDARPNSPDADKVRNYIEKSKLDFAITLPHSTAQNAEEFARVARENIDLKQQVAQLQSRLARLGDEQAAVLAVPPSTASTTAPPPQHSTDSPLVTVGPTTGDFPPSPPRAEPIAPAAARSHVIVSGDSLWKIAQQYYPDDVAYGVERIKEANPEATSNPRNLRLGTTIVIP